MKHKISIEIEVEIEGKYYAESYGSWYGNGGVGEPPEPASYEIQSVIWQGVDITKMLDVENFDFCSLEDEIIQKIENE